MTSEEESSSMGFWGWIGVIISGYAITSAIFTSILRVEWKDLPWWAHLISLLIGIPIFYLVALLFNSAQNLLVRILTFFGTAVAGIVLLVFLLKWDLHLWISLIGLGFLVVGFICANQARKNPIPRATATPDSDLFTASPELWNKLRLANEQNARLEAQKSSTAWSINSLVAYFSGIVMIIVGLVTFFIHK